MAATLSGEIRPFARVATQAPRVDPMVCQLAGLRLAGQCRIARDIRYHVVVSHASIGEVRHLPLGMDSSSVFGDDGLDLDCLRWILFADVYDAGGRNQRQIHESMAESPTETIFVWKSGLRQCLLDGRSGWADDNGISRFRPVAFCQPLHPLSELGKAPCSFLPVDRGYPVLARVPFLLDPSPYPLEAPL